MRQGLHIRVRGQVQGVGFRPFVWQLAQRFGATGHVLNDAEGVLIALACDDTDGFLHALRAEAPPLARIDAVEVTPGAVPDTGGFEIAASGAAGAETRVAPDAATCADCVDEIFAPGRRQGYAFTNCTNCGPRFSILRGLPYDRAQTTMAPFAMCPDCAAEYGDPRDRRFHAQPVACPACGPRIWLEASPGERVEGGIATAADWLRAGRILAIKGLGGFHLACDATNGDAVALLRARKRRPTKPLALMGTRAVIAAHAALTDADAALLSDPAAPVVLLPRAGAELPDAIAPGMAQLGWMLPYTPLHHLLLDAVGGPLVMTSGNLSGEPQVIGNDEAREKLAHLVDGFLMHDREIARRLDDGVERMTPQGPMVLRRGRGRAPGTLPLPPGFGDAPQVAAYGAHLKSAICLTKNGQALLSHHLGDLDDPLTWEEFVKADADYRALFDHRPALAACDLHRDYRSSAHAAGLGLPLVEVQHHHAHLAACLAENLWPLDGGPVAGIILDGLGLGADGTVWGGEVLLGDYHGFTRAAHLAPAPLIGGDAASRQPWRNALARLDDAGLSGAADALFPDRPRDALRQARDAGLSSPLSSSAGRLFDAVAAIAGFAAQAQSFEGEAAMWLEAQAGDGQADPYPFDIAGGVIDPAPMIRAAHSDRAKGPAIIAARFHAGLAQAFGAQARRLVETGAARAVVLSGGCFQNATLLGACARELSGLPVLIHTRTPANDGGLALGQAVIAAAQAVRQ